jgi:GT2 family glycosyltransferase/glycosyltransferase involved in cell wall biosynthesis
MRILLVTHGFPPRDLGGSQLYAEAHALAFAAAGDDVLVLTREADGGRPERAVRRERRAGVEVVWINNTFAETRSVADTYADERIDAVVEPILDAFRPQIAHVHHLTCLSTTLVPALARRGVAVFMTLHDYWLICHRGQLLDTSLRPCAGSEPDGCGRCLGPIGAVPRLAFAPRGPLRRLVRLVAHPARSAAALAMRVGGDAVGRRSRAASRRRLAHMRAIAGAVTRFYAPSTYVRDRFVRFGLDPGRITVSPYGWELPPTTEDAASAATDPGVALRLGFVGSLMPSKAPHLLIEAAGRLPEGTVQVHVHGEPAPYHGDSSYADALGPLLARPYVRLHGRLERAGLRAALAGLHALVMPSIWPETSGLVVREALLAGVPVVASRIGGLPEAVVDGENGLLVEPGEVDALYRALQRLVQEPGLLPRLRQGRRLRTLADDTAALRRDYARAIGDPTVTRPATPAPVRPRLAAVVLNHRTPDDTYLAVRSVLLARRRPDDVIVVDNDDRESCRSALAPFAGQVRYVHSGANLGFAGGMNVGIREALAGGAAAVLLLNSDVVVPVEAIGLLEGAIATDATVGVAGPVVLARQAPDRVASLGMRYQPWSGRMRHDGVGTRWAAPDKASTRPVAGVSGCCMLLRREVLVTTGGFDEAYFFGFEDLDLCLRAADAGYVTVVVDAATVLHEGQRTIGAASPARLYFAVRNHLRLAAGRGPGGPLRTGRQLVVYALAVAHAIRDGRGPAGARLAAVWRGTRDHLRGVYGPAPR